MALVDTVDAGTPDRLRRDQPEALEVSQRLLNSTQAVALRDQSMDPSSRQRRARAEQRGERGTSRSRQQATEGFTEVHMNKLLVI